MIHLVGGVMLFAGVAGHVAPTGNVAFTRMAPDSIAHWLILIGFLVNAGAPPLSAWLPDAYPEASWSGTVFLSAFTTKTAVYVLLRGFPGHRAARSGSACSWSSTASSTRCWKTTCGASWPIRSSTRSGFMVAGIGIGTEMALNGAAAHAFTHIIYKALLLMSAGSVLLMTGTAQVLGARRAVPHHAADDRLRHDRRARDLVVPADLGFRHRSR